jgi:hypothetical protein
MHPTRPARPCGSAALQAGGGAAGGAARRRWRAAAGPRDQEDNEAPSTSYNNLSATIKCARPPAPANGWRALRPQPGKGPGGGPGLSALGARGAPSPTPPAHAPPSLGRRKQRQLEAQLTELGMEALDERLQSATQVRVGRIGRSRVCARAGGGSFRRGGRDWKCVRPRRQGKSRLRGGCRNPAAATHPASLAPRRWPQIPVTTPYRLTRLISQITSTEGRAAILVEIARPSPSATPVQLAALAKRAVAAVRGGRGRGTAAGHAATRAPLLSACPPPSHPTGS